MPLDSTTKRCTKCGETKPLDNFIPSSRYKSGYQSQCRTCRNAAKREKRASDPEWRAREIAAVRQYQAEHAEEVRRREREYRRGRRQDPAYRLARSRRENARVKQLRKTDPVYLEKERARSRENARRYYADPEHAEQGRQYRRNRYYTHAGYRSNVLRRAALSVHVRRARLQANGGSFTSDEWTALCAQYDHRCLCCGAQKPLTIDHVVPISKGGDNFISNIQPLCETCNKSKGDKTIDYRTPHLH